MLKNILIILIVILSFTGCGEQRGPNGGPAFGGGTPEVGVVTIESSAVPMTAELSGRLTAVRAAQVRARATGIILKQEFTQGADVLVGDVLFRVDPAHMEANLRNAQAALASAQATAFQVKAKQKRFDELVKIHAVSQQEAEDVSALALRTSAEVQAAQAVLDTAQLNLGYTTVTAPIAGRIGPALVTEGALVSQTEATQLALIQQLDPIYFDLTQSSSEVLRLKQAFDQGQIQRVDDEAAAVTLLLEDGSEYAHKGRLLFSGIDVDPTTSSITLRAEFPNPEHLLLPGMFARGRFPMGVNAHAVTAPQRALILGPGGTATAMVVGPDNKVEARIVRMTRALGDKWIVTDGLRAGEQVIVEGYQKVQPGATVKPVPFNTSGPTNPVNTNHDG